MNLWMFGRRFGKNAAMREAIKEAENQGLRIGLMTRWGIFCTRCDRRWTSDHSCP